MLNISEKRIDSKVDKTSYSSFRILQSRMVTQWLIRVLAIISLIAFIALFLPWTQNIRAKGYVNTLRPSDRPQSIQALIGGRIEKWYVIEGEKVKMGDTIVRISEIKEEYLDPEILLRTKNQIEAKKGSAQSYGDKAENLIDQYYALINSRDIKLKQNEIKRRQIKLKIESDSIALIAAQTKKNIAENQLNRMEELYKEGLKPLTDLEAKRFSIREAEAKVLSLENKLRESRNDLDNIDANIIEINNSYRDKVAKSKSDMNAAKSEQFNSEAEMNKLQSQYNAYEVRQNNYFITSPINGIITRAIQSGIGEMIKAGDDLVTIMPDKYELAVEMYVEPVDVPLLKVGQKVRVQFDGWPSIVFSGWPNASVGTFGGKVFAIDNFISDNGKYRVLVSEDPSEIPWPEEVRVGGGANTITLLKNVKLGYEIWRQLNGFPPDYYASTSPNDVETKAPLKKVK